VGHGAAEDALPGAPRGRSPGTRAERLIGPLWRAKNDPAEAVKALRADRRSDVYSLGVILYQLLTGELPFRGSKAMLIQQVLREEPRPPRKVNDKIPRDLETICLKCLQKDPHKRYASARALADDLGRFLAGEPILARPVSALERCWRWCRRNPRAAALSAVVLVLLVAVAATSTWFAITVAQERDAKEREKLAAELARNLADRNAEQARQAQRRADDNARVAQEQANLAVKTFYQVVVELQNQLRDRPDMQKLREKLLKDALAGLHVVAKNAENSTLLLRTLDGAYQRMGDVGLELGQTAEAGRQYDRALAIFAQLAALDPADEVGKWNLAVMYEKEGTINHQLHGDIIKTRDYYRKATQIYETLAAGPRREPKLTQPLVDNALAGSYGRLYHRPPAGLGTASPAQQGAGGPLRDADGTASPDGLQHVRRRF
jgi:hypothetical protein